MSTWGRSATPRCWLSTARTRFPTRRPLNVTWSVAMPSALAEVVPPPLEADMTTEGVVDWAHFGRDGVAANMDRKAQPSHKAVSELEVLGGGGLRAYLNNPVLFSWSDGEPTPAESGQGSGVYTAGGTGHGFSLSVDLPASGSGSSALQQCFVTRVYVGVYKSRGRMTVKGAGLSFVDTSLDDSSGTEDGVYTITTCSSSPATLTLEWVMDKNSGDGNITFQAVTVATTSTTPTAAVLAYALATTS
eukprot:m.202879 g.202879  ORF g.202879 m.202879 type:complete len:246 (+) comp18443_c0_seq1:2563-3300(+)